jgi:hypothetical protein
MSQATTRGHVILHTAAFIKRGGPTMDHHLDAQTSVELRAALDTMAAADSYPRRFQIELLSALISAHGTDTNRGYESVRRCGAALLPTSNQFHVLLMKVLTPELLIKKLARFWLRDHGTSGSCEVITLDVDARAARVRLSGVAGYDHIGVFWLGWLEGMLGQLAGSVEVRQSGWSATEPGPNEIVYEARWS